jgi:hypothetical protein
MILINKDVGVIANTQQKNTRNSKKTVHSDPKQAKPRIYLIRAWSNSPSAARSTQHFGQSVWAL